MYDINYYILHSFATYPWLSLIHSLWHHDNHVPICNACFFPNASTRQVSSSKFGPKSPWRYSSNPVAIFLEERTEAPKTTGKSEKFGDLVVSTIKGNTSSVNLEPSFKQLRLNSYGFHCLDARGWNFCWGSIYIYIYISLSLSLPIHRSLRLSNRRSDSGWMFSWTVPLHHLIFYDSMSLIEFICDCNCPMLRKKWMRLDIIDPTMVGLSRLASILPQPDQYPKKHVNNSAKYHISMYKHVWIQHPTPSTTQLLHSYWESHVFFLWGKLSIYARL